MLHMKLQLRGFTLRYHTYQMMIPTMTTAAIHQPVPDAPAGSESILPAIRLTSSCVIAPTRSCAVDAERPSASNCLTTSPRLTKSMHLVAVCLVLRACHDLIGADHARLSRERQHHHALRSTTG